MPTWPTKPYRLWVRNRRLYGRRKPWKATRRAGITTDDGRPVGRDQIERLMKLAGIGDPIRTSRHTIRPMPRPLRLRNRA